MQLCAWITGHALRSYSSLPAGASCWAALDLDREYPVVWYSYTLARGQVFIPRRQWSFAIALDRYTYFVLPRRWRDCGDEDY